MTCEEVAWEVIKRLPDDIVIHRYDSYSTNSIYLKFDYGIANSLRISDHKGKKHLKYRFNVILDLDHKKSEVEKGCVRLYYPPSNLDDLISSILENYEAVKKRARNYEALVNWKKQQIDKSAGFWSGAQLVNRKDYM